MFAPPSYLYSGLDKETIELTNELDDLGGGDVKISNMKLYVSINTQIKATDRQVLWNYSSMLGIRDITLPRNSPVTKSMQYYPVTDIILLSNHLSGTEGNRNYSSHTDHINHSNNKSSDTHQQHHHRRVSDKYSEVINDILNNVDKGFNACLLTMGMSNSWKTYHLFGDLGCYDCIQSINVDHDRSLHTASCWDSIAYGCLERLYHNYHHARDHHTATSSSSSTTTSSSSTTTIAISCWFVQSDKTIDLLIPVINKSSSAAHHPLDFTSVECPTLDIAIELLHHCRNRATGCLSKHHHHNHHGNIDEHDDKPINSMEQQQHHRGHFFFRVLIHRKDDTHHHHHHDDAYNDDGTGSITYLYLIDLVGFVSVDSQFFKQLNNKQQILCRDNNMQLQTLLKVLHEMVELSKTASIHNLTQSSLPSISSSLLLPQSSSSSQQKIGQFQSIITVDGSDSMIKMTSARGKASSS